MVNSSIVWGLHHVGSRIVVSRFSILSTGLQAFSEVVGFTSKYPSEVSVVM